MSAREILHRLIELRCVALKYNPIRHPAGLLPVGDPGPDSPVFVSGNYFLAVRMLLRALHGRDAWLLVADSAGINVWCAAGVCDFNEHKIADAVHATGLADRVAHRRLILPPLAAVGIDLATLEAECGFRGAWGPVHAEDIPAFLDAGLARGAPMRLVRFPFRDRLINAVGVFCVFLPLAALAGRDRARRHFILAANAWMIFGNFLPYPAIPARHPANKSLLVALVGLALLLAAAARPAGARGLPFRLLYGAVVALLVSIDMIGSTPFYKTTIARWFAALDNESLFQPAVTGDCTRCGACVEVCPKGIFRLPDGAGPMAVDRTRECMECLACLKQCPRGAIRNIGTGFKDDIKSVPDPDRFRAAAPAGDAA